MSTEHLEPEQKDVLSIIKSNVGCTYDIIYAKCDLDKKDLSLVLHRLTQLGCIFKQKDSYFVTNINDSDMDTFNAKKAKEAEAKLLAKVESQASKPIKQTSINPNAKNEERHPWKESSEVIEEKKKQQQEVVKKAAITTPPKKVEKPFGNYYRGAAPGIVALFFYMHRNDSIAFSVANIVKELGVVTKLGDRLDPVVYNMSNAGVIEVVNPEDYKKFYKWSGKLAYPFSKMDSSDKFILPGNVELKSDTTTATVSAEDAEKTQIKQPVIAPNKPLDVPTTIPSDGLDEMLGIKVMEANKSAVEIIDVRIEYLLNEIKHLETVKERLLNI